MNRSDTEADRIVSLALDGKVDEANRAYAEAIAQSGRRKRWRMRGVVVSAGVLIACVVSAGIILF